MLYIPLDNKNFQYKKIVKNQNNGLIKKTVAKHLILIKNNNIYYYISKKIFTCTINFHV